MNTFGNVFNSFNQVYMAALMTASMVLIELPLMLAMYKSKKLNATIIVVGLIVLVGSFLLIRKQGAISDRQFLRSMIPHHAAAILMCEEASLEGSEIKELCRNIIAGQQAEIDQMKAKLDQLGKWIINIPEEEAMRNRIKSGKLIVLYIGENQTVVDVLRTTLGNQLAGM